MIESIKKRVASFEKNLSKNQKKLWGVLLFLIKFGIASLPIYLVMFFNLDFFLLQDIEARQTNTVINLLGTNSSVQYCAVSECSYDIQGMPTIIHGDKAIGIDRACTGYRSFFALLGLMLAVPGISREKRLKGILMALLVVYMANITRLASTFYLSGIFGFDLVHGLMWKEGMIAVVFLSWIVWLKKL